MGGTIVPSSVPCWSCFVQWLWAQPPITSLLTEAVGAGRDATVAVVTHGNFLESVLPGWPHAKNTQCYSGTLNVPQQGNAADYVVQDVKVIYLPLP
jgi:hypothetical protein